MLNNERDAGVYTAGGSADALMPICKARKQNLNFTNAN